MRSCKTLIKNPTASPNPHTCRDNALMVRCVLDKEYL